MGMTDDRRNSHSGWVASVGASGEAVVDAEEERRQDDPKELVPVEEREAENDGRVPGVELGKAEGEVGQHQEQPAGTEVARGRGGSCLQWLRAGIISKFFVHVFWRGL